METLETSHDIPEPIAEKFTDKNILKQIQTAMKKAGFDQDNYIATWLPGEIMISIPDYKGIPGGVITLKRDIHYKRQDGIQFTDIGAEVLLARKKALDQLIDTKNIRKKTRIFLTELSSSIENSAT